MEKKVTKTSWPAWCNNASLLLVKSLSFLILLIILLGLLSQALRAEEFILPPEMLARQNLTEANNKAKSAQRLELLLEYYDNCTNFAYSDLSVSRREAYCACTAERLDNIFSLDEIYTVTKGQGPRLDTARLAIEMEGPCIAHPIKEDTESHCLNTARTNHFRTQEGFSNYCACVGQKAYDFLNAYGRDLVALLLNVKQSPPQDLAFAIRQSRNYKLEFAAWRKSCLLEFSERGKH